MDRIELEFSLDPNDSCSKHRKLHLEHIAADERLAENEYASHEQYLKDNHTIATRDIEGSKCKQCVL